MVAAIVARASPSWSTLTPAPAITEIDPLPFYANSVPEAVEAARYDPAIWITPQGGKTVSTNE